MFGNTEHSMKPDGDFLEKEYYRLTKENKRFRKLWKKVKDEAVFHGFVPDAVHKIDKLLKGGE